MQIAYIQKPGEDVALGSGGINDLDLDEIERLIDAEDSTHRKAGSQQRNTNVY